LAKGDLKHEEPLRSWLKPESGKAQRSNFAGVYGVDDEPTINTIPREAVWVPSQKADGGRGLLHFCHHLIEYLSTRLLCALALNESLGDNQPFSLGIFSQLRKLGFYAHHLPILILDTFAGIEKVFNAHKSPLKSPLAIPPPAEKARDLEKLASLWRIAPHGKKWNGNSYFTGAQRL
jgi:hypothetical protein